MTIQDKPALILIDIQKGFEDIDYWGGHRNNPGAEANARKLLDFWRLNNLPVFHTQHCSVNPKSKLVEGQSGNEIMEIVKPAPGEVIIKKNVNSAFIGTDLKQQLDNANIKKLVVAGLTTDHCVSTTVRMAANFGFETYLVSDASATFDKLGPDGKKYSAEQIHDTSLAVLHQEFAFIITSEEIIGKLHK